MAKPPLPPLDFFPNQLSPYASRAFSWRHVYRMLTVFEKIEPYVFPRNLKPFGLGVVRNPYTYRIRRYSCFGGETFNRLNLAAIVPRTYHRVRITLRIPAPSDEQPGGFVFDQTIRGEFVGKFLKRVSGWGSDGVTWSRTSFPVVFRKKRNWF